MAAWAGRHQGAAPQAQARGTGDEAQQVPIKPHNQGIWPFRSGRRAMTGAERQRRSRELRKKKQAKSMA
jgi:hypothetical protein